MSDTVTTEELKEMLRDPEQVTVLDIRSKPAYLAQHIPGSIHADASGQLMSGDTTPLTELDLPKERPVVVVCAVGSRSQLAAAFLQSMGYTAYSLAGGMQEWDRTK
jgi:rhodanese-related sulfurtransferase